MLHLVWRMILARRERTALLLLGVLIVSGAFGLLLSAVETTRVIVDEDIARSWRTTYDILVRPAGSRSPVEEQYGLVQANHLSNLDGGITLAQYQAIRRIPGVEVAAPIAMLGYFQLVFQTPLEVECSPGFYRLVNSVTAGEGVREDWIDGEEFFYCAAPDGDLYHLFDSSFYTFNAGMFYGMSAPESKPWYRRAVFGLPVLLAAIDPQQERLLVGLDQAIIQGQYLHDVDAAGPTAGVDIPLILNTRNYASFTLRTEWQRIDLPFSQAALQEVQAANAAGEKPFAGRAVELLQQWAFPGQQAYQAALDEMREPGSRTTINQLVALPQAMSYRQIPPFPGVQGPLLEAAALSTGLFEGGYQAIRMPYVDSSAEVHFRALGEGGLLGGNLPFLVQGVYDIERLGPSLGAGVPLETYFPPGVTLRYAETGQPLEPVTLQPNLSQIGYITNPPLALTTLEAGVRLNFVRPDAPISAVRIRVAGIDSFTPEAQRRIEQVAAEIIDRTGLDVDITVGSSPRQVLIHIPGINDVPPLGYVEEAWVQKGVSYQVDREVRRVNLLLFSVMLFISAVFILNTSLISTLARRREIALHKALGWRAGSVFALILSEGLVIGLVAGGLGLLLALALAVVFHWAMPLQRAVWIIPLSLALCLLGTLLPAILAARIPPAHMLAVGEITAPAFSPVGRAGPAAARLSLPVFAFRQSDRRKVRALLAWLTVASSAALVTLFLGAIFYSRGYLAGTLLGETILVHIGPFHFWVAGISFLVSAFAVADVLLMAVIERRREIGLLKALGWRSGQVFILFVWEAISLSAPAGLLGWAAGCFCFWCFDRTLPLGGLGLLLPALAAPLLVSILAALYPAWQAARVPPAAAMRYE